VPTTKEILSLWEEYAPRIAEAQERDARDKHEHFLKYFENSINGLPCKQLTAEIYLLLSVSNSLIGEKEPTDQSIFRFLWIVNPSFKKGKFAFQLFKFLNRKIDKEETLEQIGKYLEHSFQFSPSGKLKKDEETKSSPEWMSSLIDLIASEYGWTFEQIMETPLSILFMQCARIKARYTGKPIQFSREADSIKAEYLDEINSMESA
tara:strand:- start:6097 stop:6714 length:618 start_codon:yes stop_codon:yes gene_type:complete